jgi:hypothetical protein
MTDKLLLPRGITVKEKVNPGRVNLPVALEKLHSGRFTGYLRFDTPKGTGLLTFHQGSLMDALFEGEPSSLVSFDAVARIFEQSLLGESTLDIYRLSSDLALQVHSLLHGKVLACGRDLARTDIRALLRRVKETRLSGCLRVYAGERVVLIFFRTGRSLGFFHDGGKEIEDAADLSDSVARLPGAKFDILRIPPFGDAVPPDLMESADLRELWKQSQQLAARQRSA